MLWAQLSSLGRRSRGFLVKDVLPLPLPLHTFISSLPPSRTGNKPTSIAEAMGMVNGSIKGRSPSLLVPVNSRICPPPAACWGSSSAILGSSACSTNRWSSPEESISCNKAPGSVAGRTLSVFSILRHLYNARSQLASPHLNLSMLSERDLRISMATSLLVSERNASDRCWRALTKSSTRVSNLSSHSFELPYWHPITTPSDCSMFGEVRSKYCSRTK